MDTLILIAKEFDYHLIFAGFVLAFPYLVLMVLHQQNNALTAILFLAGVSIMVGIALLVSSFPRASMQVAMDEDVQIPATVFAQDVSVIVLSGEDAPFRLIAESVRSDLIFSGGDDAILTRVTINDRPFMYPSVCDLSGNCQILKPSPKVCGLVPVDRC